MKNTHLIDSVLEAHEVSVQISGPWGEVSRMNVSIPDLRSAPRNVHGDWGPMYTLQVPADQPIEVTVKSVSNLESSREVLVSGWLRVDSPMLATARETTPLVMKLPLKQEGVTLHVAYDAQGQPVSTELKPMANESSRHDAYDARLVTRRKVPSAVLDWGVAADVSLGMGS